MMAICNDDDQLRRPLFLRQEDYDQHNFSSFSQLHAINATGLVHGGSVLSLQLTGREAINRGIKARVSAHCGHSKCAPAQTPPPVELIKLATVAVVQGE